MPDIGDQKDISYINSHSTQQQYGKSATSVTYDYEHTNHGRSVITSVHVLP